MIFKENNHRKWLSLTYLAIFFLLEILIVTDNSMILGIDHSVRLFFTGIISPLNTKIFSMITFLGSPLMDVIYLATILFLLLRKGKKQSAYWIAFILISGNIISFLIKMTVKRPRPMGKIIPASGYSFPSGHVFGTALVVLTLIYLVLPYLKNQSTQTVLKLLLIVWLIVVAISRVYLRGHYFSDTIGSVLLAGTWWECSELLYIRYFDSIANWLNLNVEENE